MAPILHPADLAQQSVNSVGSDRPINNLQLLIQTLTELGFTLRLNPDLTLGLNNDRLEKYSRFEELLLLP